MVAKADLQLQDYLLTQIHWRSQQMAVTADLQQKGLRLQVWN
jgi:hypothetical protein